MARNTKAKTIRVTPSSEHPLPYDTSDEEFDTFVDKLSSVASTAELLEELGAVPELSTGSIDAEKKLLESALTSKAIAPLTKSLPAALGAASFLRTYGQNRALDIDVARAALTNKLLEIADCGDIKYELRAIELLGKHSDIGLFTQRSEININYNSPESLEAAIKERVKRLLNADIIDIKPLGMDLDEELGLTDIEEGDWEDAPIEGAEEEQTNDAE